MSQEIMKPLQDTSECMYPKCSKKELLEITLPVGEIDEVGNIHFPKGHIESSCLLCEYHIIFAEKGVVQLINREGMVILITPFQVVELIEQVIKIQEINKERKSGKKKRKKKKMSIVRK